MLSCVKYTYKTGGGKQEALQLPYFTFHQGGELIQADLACPVAVDHSLQILPITQRMSISHTTAPKKSDPWSVQKICKLYFIPATSNGDIVFALCSIDVLAICYDIENL
jgi:hypothetical protein